MISYLAKLIGTSLFLTLIIIYASENADAAPVRVEFSGELGPLLPPAGLEFLSPGGVAYASEIGTQYFEGAKFSASFIYDPFRPTSTIIENPNYTQHYGVINSAQLQIERVGGGYFSNDPSRAFLATIDNAPLAANFFDQLVVDFGALTPALPGIPGDLNFRPYIGVTEFGLDPQLLLNQMPPLDLASFSDPSYGLIYGFQMQTDAGVARIPYTLEFLTITAVPAPAPIGLFLLGLGYIVRQRMRG